jgi:Flp pilus assembly protein TadG
MLRHILRDRRGSAAVEFAFVAPLMILMYYGLAETTQGMMASRRAAHVATTIGDLTAQQVQTDPATIADIFVVGRAILAPFPTATLNMRLTSVKADSTGSPKVVWSRGYGAMAALPVGGTVAGVPTGLIGPNESTIQSEVSYTYVSSVQQALPGPIVLNQKSFLKPRKGTEVLCSTC